MDDSKKLERVVAIHFAKAKENAIEGQLFVVTDSKTKDIRPIDLKDVPINKDGLTLGMYIQNNQKQIAELTAYCQKLANVINNNNSVTTAAIESIRLELEKGKVF